MVLKLNTVGKKYVEVLVKQLKSLDIYNEGIEELMLNDIGMEYQLYRKYLNDSQNDPDKDIIMRADRHYKNVTNGLNRLCLTPTAINKLKNKPEEPKETEKDLFEGLNDIIGD